jgi:hypothetical protein
MTNRNHLLTTLITLSIACGCGGSEPAAANQSAAVTSSTFTAQLQRDEASVAALDANFFSSTSGYDSLSSQPALPQSEVLPGSDLDSALQWAIQNGFASNANRVDMSGTRVIVLLAQVDMDQQLFVYHCETQKEMAHKDAAYAGPGLWFYDAQATALKAMQLEADQLSSTPIDGTPEVVLQAISSPVAYGAMTVAGETVYLVGYAAGSDLDVQALRPDGVLIDYGACMNGQGQVAWR